MTMLKRAKSASPPAPRAITRPPWFASKGANPRYAYPYVRQLDELLGRDLFLPSFQRGLCWSAEQQVAFCNSLWEGQATAPIFVWERYRGGRKVSAVLDGQQRLTALGYPFRGEPAGATTAARLDVVRGGFVDAKDLALPPGQTALTPWDLASPGAAMWSGYDADMERHDTGDPLAYHATMASDLWRARRLIVFTLDADVVAEEALRIFKAINTPGVQMAGEDLERLIASAAECDAGL